MGTVVTSSLNFPVLADITPAEMLNIPYAGINIDTSGGEIVIQGIDLSVLCFTPADYANILAVELLIQSNLKLDPSASGDDLGIPGNLRYYHIFRVSDQDYDKSYDLTRPLPLLKSTLYAAWAFIRPSAAFAGLTRLVLNLRGGYTINNQFPYQLR
jgi:hypothetical protein